MGMLQTLKRAWKNITSTKMFEDDDELGVALPDLGGQFISWDGSWGKTKQLKAYQKSLYVFRCVSKIAQKTASIDWELFKIKNKLGDKIEIFVHEALDLLYRPNPFQTKTEFFEKYMINKLLTGQSFVLKVRQAGPGSKVVEMWNLRPDYVTIIKDKQLFIKGYEFTTQDKTIVFAPEDIIYDATPSPLDEYGGLSILQAAEVRVETEEFATKYQRYFFQNNARPDFILSSDDKISQKQKDEIKEDWDKKHKGVMKAGRGAFLEMGLKYQQVSISQREMDYIESLKMTRDDILTAFAVPKPIIAITEDVNYANAKTAMEIFLKETIEPEIIRITEKLNEHLIYPEWGDIYFIEYDKSFIPTDDKNQAEVNQIHLASGTKLINEVREELGLPPIVGGWSLYMPLSNVAVGGLPQKGNKAKKIDNRKIFRGRKKAYDFIELKEQIADVMIKGIIKDIKHEKQNGKPLIKAEIRNQYADYVLKAIDAKTDRFKPEIVKFSEEQKKRVVAKLGKIAKGESKSLASDIFDKKSENKLFAELSIPFITEFVESAGKEAMQTIAPAEEFTLTERIQKYIKERAKELADNVNNTTVDKLVNTLAEGIANGEGIAKLTDRVNLVYEEFPVYRAETIARTETTAANNKGFIESYQQSGVANAKEWIATLDNRTRDSHAETDGEIVGLEESFSNGLDYPGDPGADPAETINCRCVLAPAFKE